MHLYFLFVSILLAISVTVANEDVYTVQYDTENFETEISKKNHFIMFYAPWSGNCQKLAPTWEKLAEHFNTEESDVTIAKINCVSEKTICDKLSTRNYPVLLFFRVNESEALQYLDKQSFNKMKFFVSEQLGIPYDTSEEEEEEEEEELLEPKEVSEGLYEIAENHFFEHIATGKHFIKFYAPHCGFCLIFEPVWKELAKFYQHEDIWIEQVDCMKNKKLCTICGVRGYPTILWYEEGEKLDENKDDETLEEFVKYVEKMFIESKELLKEAQEIRKKKNEEYLLYYEEKGRVWEEEYAKLVANITAMDNLKKALEANASLEVNTSEDDKSHSEEGDATKTDESGVSADEKDNRDSSAEEDKPWAAHIEL